VLSGPALPATEGTVGDRDSQRVAIDCWGAALERGDGDEVDRLVRQSRADWVEVATSGRMGPMLGQSDPSPIGDVE
jgi:hypothetical protein